MLMFRGGQWRNTGAMTAVTELLLPGVITTVTYFENRTRLAAEKCGQSWLAG